MPSKPIHAQVASSVSIKPSALVYLGQIQMAEIIELHPVKGEARLTTPNPPAYAGITATYRGHRTRQNCEFFMPEIRARSATHRRGTESGKRPFSRTRIGVLRSTQGTKAGFHPRTNNRGRRYAVVAAWKRHPYSLPLVASPGIDSFQFGATTMTTLKPSTLVYLGQIQAERSSIRQSIPVE